MVLLVLGTSECHRNVSNSLLSQVKPLIEKKDTKFRKWILAAERLALTLRLLATGDSQQSLSLSFGIGKATVSKISSETCDAVYLCRKIPIFLHRKAKKNG